MRQEKIDPPEDQRVIPKALETIKVEDIMLAQKGKNLEIIVQDLMIN